MNEKYIRLYGLLKNEFPILLTSYNSKKYLTDYDGDDSKLLILPSGDSFYFTDERYGGDATDFFAGRDIQLKLLPLSEQNSYIKRILHDAAFKDCYVEDRALTVSEFNQLQTEFNDISFSALGNAVERLRRIKDNYELSLISRAQDISDKAFGKILKVIRPGMTEREVAFELEYQMKRFGADGVAFETIVAAGRNSACPHAKVSTKKIENKSFVTLDFGARVGSYCSDMTRTVFVGRPTREQKQLYKHVQKAQKMAIGGLTAGKTGKEIDSYCREYLTANGLGDQFIHSTGHGVGLDVHEYPRLGAGSEDVLCENMVVTVEPGIYFDGKFGIRIEDLLIVKGANKRTQCLTGTTRDLIVL